MANSALTPVEFHGASLFVTIINNVLHVALRQICEALGLDTDAQLKRIKRHPVLSTCTAITTVQMPGDDQAREVLMLPLDKLNGWLFGVQVGRVKPELRPRLIQYQSECFDVLDSHFGVKPPVSTLPEPSLKNRRWLVSFDHTGREVVQSVPADAFILTVPELCHAVLMGEISGRDFIDLAYAVNQRQFTLAVENKHRGYGEEVAAKVKDMSWSDLHIINQKTAMEVWMRSQIPAKVAA